MISCVDASGAFFGLHHEKGRELRKTLFLTRFQTMASRERASTPGVPLKPKDQGTARCGMSGKGNTNRGTIRRPWEELFTHTGVFESCRDAQTRVFGKKNLRKLRKDDLRHHNATGEKEDSVNHDAGRSQNTTT